MSANTWNSTSSNEKMIQQKATGGSTYTKWLTPYLDFRVNMIQQRRKSIFYSSWRLH